MTRKSTILLLAMSLILGCTSDQLGFRSTYRDRNVTSPWASPQSNSNPPVAGQPGVRLGQSVILPQSAVSNLAVQGSRTGFNSPYPMLASAGGQIDGRPYPLINRVARLPGKGGARHRKSAVRNEALAGGIVGSPQEDLKYRGGRTIKDLQYMNIYVGNGKSWVAADVSNIDKALDAAMTDPKLNNVIMQYFGNRPVSSQFLGSFFMDGWKPRLVAKSDLENQVIGLYRQHNMDGRDLKNTVFNFMLPKGMILGDPNGGQQQAVSNKAIPHEEAEDSTGGLGGYHGSAHVDGKTIYYAVGVYSERLPSGQSNGIPVFDENWKNVVGTFYHELQEARTDPDVDDAQESPNGASVLGWTSDSGNEIGDYPIAEAQQLIQVFKEVPLSDGSGNVPIQLQYSNAVHGPEGPIDYPHGLEPPPGSVPVNNPLPNKPVPNKPSNPSNGLPADLGPELTRLISNWGQLEDYIKQAILKLAS